MKEWTPDSLIAASGMYWESCVIQAAVGLDFFSPLAEGPLDMDELAARIGCRPGSAARLATALCALGLLRREGKACALEPSARRWLCRDSPDYIGHIIDHHRHLMPGWSRLDEAVRTGLPVRARTSVETRDEAERASFLMGMRNIADAQAAQSVPQIDLGGRTRLLDLGGATGAYAIHFCRANPGLTATVFDLPTTRPFAESVIEQEGMTDRVNFVGGDFTRDGLPSGFDVAWLSQILHGAGLEASRNIVATAARALVPGGLLLIQEFILDDDRNGPVHPALFDLNMLVGTPEGQAYTESELAHMMEAGGLAAIHRLPIRLPQGCGIMAGSVGPFS